MRARTDDIKLVWEIGRFPHAFVMARAACVSAELRPTLASALADQLRSFIEDNPRGVGVHWASGQEIAFRVLAWLFAARTLFAREPSHRAAYDAISSHAWASAHHIEHHIEYARKAVYNNHILAEALGLLAIGGVFANTEAGERWRCLGRELLDEQVPLQFYPDGGYLQRSHTYHRIALQVLIAAIAFCRAFGERPSQSWLDAIDRSVTFLHALQNPNDGRLPNFGPNDGGLPLVLSTCDYQDFRPVLQTASLLTRARRLYPPGPWDEEALWLLGLDSLDAPVREVERRSLAFGYSGHHVLRSVEDPTTFSTFHCGDLHDRFGQIDMLHVDVWWRGHNVLVDGGSYLYNGPQVWHQHFLRTGSHNTVVVDGRDQMLHFRRFKSLYPTRATLLRFDATADHQLVVGEHRGYFRHPGRVVHKRSLLFVPDDLWVVVDELRGVGVHDGRLHWLAGPFPHAVEGDRGSVSLDTPSGEFRIAVMDSRGTPIPVDVARGQDDPPRGWQARYYGEKQPVPSIVARRNSLVPFTFVTLLTAGESEATVNQRTWLIRNGPRLLHFRLADGTIEDISVNSAASKP
jgi:asparagine synthase (glutamine-hydrolysing)